MPLPYFCSFAGIFGVPWLVEASPLPLPSWSHGVLPVHIYLQISPFLWLPVFLD